MSLGLRLGLLLGALVLLTALLSWALAGRSVVAPLARALYETRAEQAIELTQRIEAGESPEKLGTRLGLDIKVSASFDPDRRKRWRERCDRETRGGREVVHCRGPKSPVAVRSALGWVLIRRDLDIEDPGGRFARLLVLSGLAVLLVGAYLTRIITKPLRQTSEAMERVARGELEHRLLEEGPKELAQVARAYNAMTIRVKEMLESERKLMAGISHELRTPLARLMLELEMLRDRGGDEKRLDAMAQDLGEVDRLIGELLESSRLSIGAKQLDLRELELGALARVATEKVCPRARVEVSDKSCKVRCDEERMLRVVTNLLSNAQKYAGEGADIRVKIDGTTLEVSDDGPGVPEESLPRLFEPFYRVPRSDGKKGSGLGLMIARQIVELHGGTISARNLPSGGFSVRIELKS